MNKQHWALMAYKPAHTMLARQQNHGACLLCLQLINCRYFSSLADALGKYCHDVALIPSQYGMSQCPFKSQLHDSAYWRCQHCCLS